MKNFNLPNANRWKTIFCFLFFVLAITLSGFSQNVGINSNGNPPNASAGLDVDFPDKGLLIPRVALTGTANFAPLSAHVAGMVVYNTATAGDVIPGFYYNDGSKWISGFPKGNAIGDMLYWTGSAWNLLPVGTTGQYLTLNASNIPFWATANTGVYATLSTTAASAITGITATSGGNITNDGGLAVLSRGVCWKTTTGPTIADSKTIDGSGIGTFTSSLTGLLPVTTYYVRVYSTNSSSTTYGNEITFTTTAILPTLAATYAASAIAGTTANSGGNVTSTGGAPILERGVCYATTANPTITNSKVIDPTPGAGTFTSNLTGLTGGTLYYVRSYATNSIGTAYGAQIQFTTLRVPPTLVTVAASNIGGASASSGGSMNWNGPGYSNYQNYGVAYSTTPNAATPTYVNTNTTNYPWTTPIPPWTTNITGLAANTTYYIRSFLYIYTGGTPTWSYVYGNELSFTTTGPSAPTVGATTAASLITGSTVRTGGTITSDGGSAITAKGVCWGITPNPTKGVGNFSSDGTGNTTFTSNLTGLSGSTNYYVRAYATNALGTSYSAADITFTTLPASLYTLGQNVGYGIVGYIAPDGTGFIVSPNIPYTGGWGCNTINVVGVGTAIGTGKNNTDLIIASCGTSTAAGTAKAYTGGGFNDWYLPSSSEWGQIATRFTSYGINSGNYYTSSQYGTNYTYAATYFNTGPSGTCYSSGALRVNGTFMGGGILAIRNFGAAPAVAPNVASTSAITNIAATSATSGGLIASDGGSAITAKGVCWSTTSNPTIADSKTTDGTGTASFVSSITGLTTGTPYYVRAYATNSVNTSYGPEISFTPVAPGFPNVSTAAITNLAATSATSGGNVTSDGGVTVTARGVCWSTLTGPTIADSKTIDGGGTGAFVSSVTGLITGTTYYLRAYATNATGTSYGAEFNVTPITLATLTTDAVTGINATTATSGGNITNNGGSAVTARGVCWSTVTGPTITDPKTTNGTGSGVFVSNLTGLTNGVTYFVKAYATNGAGTAYGSEVSFTASGPGLPTVTTDQPTTGTSSTVTSGGNVTNDGGSAITARGVVYSSTSFPPTLLDPHTTDGSGTGIFTSSLTGLVAGNNYTIIAYATNSTGTAYGNEVYYMPVGLPTVTAGQLTYNTPDNFAQLPLYVPNTGGGTLSAYGAVWGTTPNPTVLSHQGITAENLANFFMYQNAFISPLNPDGSVTYYLRAYATNENGTTYGTEITLTPGVAGIPTVQTDPIINKIGSLAEGGGNILSDGGDPIISGGLCWGLSANPTVGANMGMTTDGFSGQFYSVMTGLTVGTTYHVRAYATNSTGTAYGADLNFVATAATIGQVIQGGTINGIVFSVDGTGSHGLMASPWFIGGEADWGCGNTLLGTGTAVGTGFNNTSAINTDNFNNSCVSTSPMGGFAADVASWQGWTLPTYLPSKDEFNLLWTNASAAGIPVTSATVQKFWSSSEVDGTNVWYFDAQTDPLNPVWVNTGTKGAMYTPWPISSF